MSSNLYDHDFYAWANEQAGVLRTGKLYEADIQNIAEELDRSIFPAACPWSFEQITDADFWPEG